MAIILPFGFLYTPAHAATRTYGGFYTADGSSESSAERQQRINSYRRQSSDLQKKIDALDDDADEDVTMPVLFGVTLNDISPNFGDPRSGGRTHEGEDILGVKGTPVVSPTEAVVLRAVTGASEGNAVYTANPGGEVFVYMHLDRFGEGVSAGDVLERGSLIGYLGDTGNAAGGPAHLHFEIHDKSNKPTDPFPRLTEEFSLKQKISYLEDILKQTDDEDELAEFLVTNFRATFNAALAADIELPDSMVKALATVPVNAPRAASAGSALPSGDLDLGSSGAAVIALQTYLIQAASGPAAASLAKAGATGTFGPLTKAALIELQIGLAIKPASGYYGPETRSYVEKHPNKGSAVVTTPVASPTQIPAAGTASSGAVRDLELGMTGEDVRALQIVLNANGYPVAITGSGSLGNETTYFGPATKAAVIKFQTENAIRPAAGYVGPVTRAALAFL
ncbi:MAG TPA: peptidoglycan-binding protein [Candidatus Paceibacterota bacterium]|nr:peptidoglycan-binding protein [Candidatus Paceibacterota bacterium]